MNFCRAGDPQGVLLTMLRPNGTNARRPCRLINPCMQLPAANGFAALFRNPVPTP